MTFDDHCEPMLFPMKKYMERRYLFAILEINMDILTFSEQFLIDLLKKN